MISYEEAKKKVLDARPDYDTCSVRENSIIFSSSKDEISTGGSESIVMLKEDGQTYN
jgi:hypothetical protein